MTNTPHTTTTRLTRYMLALALLHFGTACLSSTDETGAEAEEELAGDDSATNALPNASSLSEIARLTVDASAQEAWVYVDLDTAQVVDVVDANADTVWDLALQRFRVKTNGGVSGLGGVEALLLGKVDFAEVSEAPAEGYRVDQTQDVVAEGGFNSGDVDSPFNGEDDDWYTYNPVNHTLSSAEFVYVVKSTEGKYFKLAFTGYYSEAGSPGHVSFEFASLSIAGE